MIDQRARRYLSGDSQEITRIPSGYSPPDTERPDLADVNELELLQDLPLTHRLL
jgi:hypothetical protein